jgi:hypothetical protein
MIPVPKEEGKGILSQQRDRIVYRGCTLRYLDQQPSGRGKSSGPRILRFRFEGRWQAPDMAAVLEAADKFPRSSAARIDNNILFVEVQGRHRGFGIIGHLLEFVSERLAEYSEAMSLRVAKARAARGTAADGKARQRHGKAGQSAVTGGTAR